MNKTNRVLMAALAAAGLIGAVGGTILLPETAVAATKEKAPPISDKVRKPLAAAQEQITAKNWDQAAVHVQEALAVEGKTPYEEYQVNDFAWFVYVQQKKYPESAAALEKVVNSGLVAPDVLPQRTKVLTQLFLQTKEYSKAIEYGNRYLQLAPGDKDVGLQVAQALYLSKDYAGAKAAAEKLVAASNPPGEAALQLALRSNYELKNDAGTLQALEALVRYYPQPKYWEDLLNAQLFRTKEDRGLRDLYRLINDTSTLDKGEEYAEMGATLINGGFPNEAKQVLERGLSAGLLSGDARGRAQADLAKATTQAAADARDLPNADKMLATAKTGNEMVATGKLLFSAGEYARAADAIRKGLSKGGVTDTDDANMLLGIALARAGKNAEANAAFGAVRDPKLVDVAHLWRLRLETLDKAAPPAG